MKNTSSNFQPIVISGSTRSDGTKRPDIKFKPGYIPQELIPTYVIPQKKVIISEIATQSKLIETRNEQQHKEDQHPNDYNQKEGIVVPIILPENQQFQAQDGKRKTKKRIRRNKGDTENVNEPEESKQKELEKTEGVLTERIIRHGEKVIENIKEKAEQILNEKSLNKINRKASNVSKKSSEEGEFHELTEKKHKIRNLKKKLKGIEVLEEKKNNGNILNADEIKKLNSKKDILAQINDLTISLKNK